VVCKHKWKLPEGDGGIRIRYVLATCSLCGEQKSMCVSAKSAYRKAGLPTDAQCRRMAREAGQPR